MYDNKYQDEQFKKMKPVIVDEDGVYKYQDEQFKKMKNKSSFLNNCYEWLFSEEERKPIGFIVVFFLMIIISMAVSLFIVAVDRYMEGWVNYLWN